ncbi:MAG: hypothetical protein JJD98_00445 [Polaromonas sp.]|nr:hypothetical protein [Polaromonas sp.]
MAAKKQQLGRNSAANVVKLVSEMAEQVALPAGVILRNDAEMVIWKQFTHARAREGWRDFDLLIVAKAVRLEADIRKYQQALDKSSPIVKSDKGTQIVNPFFAVIDNLQRQQLALIRSLSLNQTGQDPRTLNGQGQEQSRLRGVMAEVDDLIAR